MLLMMLLVFKVAHHSLESVIMATLVFFPFHLHVSVWVLSISRGSCVLMLDSQLEGTKTYEVAPDWRKQVPERVPSKHCILP